MFKWLRGPREETKPIAADDNRIAAKPSERGEPPRDVDTIEELVRIVGEAHDDPRSRNDAGLLEQARVASARVGLGKGDECGAHSARKIPPLLPMCFPIRFSGKQRTVRCCLSL